MHAAGAMWSLTGACQSSCYPPQVPASSGYLIPVGFPRIGTAEYKVAGMHLPTIQHLHPD